MASIASVPKEISWNKLSMALTLSIKMIGSNSKTKPLNLLWTGVTCLSEAQCAQKPECTESPWPIVQHLQQKPITEELASHDNLKDECLSRYFMYLYHCLVFEICIYFLYRSFIYLSNYKYFNTLFHNISAIDVWYNRDLISLFSDISAIQTHSLATGIWPHSERQV